MWRFTLPCGSWQRRSPRSRGRRARRRTAPRRRRGTASSPGRSDRAGSAFGCRAARGTSTSARPRSTLWCSGSRNSARILVAAEAELRASSARAAPRRCRRVPGGSRCRRRPRARARRPEVVTPGAARGSARHGADAPAPAARHERRELADAPAAAGFGVHLPRAVARLAAALALGRDASARGSGVRRLGVARPPARNDRRRTCPRRHSRAARRPRLRRRRGAAAPPPPRSPMQQPSSRPPSCAAGGPSLADVRGTVQRNPIRARGTSPRRDSHPRETGSGHAICPAT